MQDCLLLFLLCPYIYFCCLCSYCVSSQFFRVLFCILFSWILVVLILMYFLFVYLHYSGVLCVWLYLVLFAFLCGLCCIILHMRVFFVLFEFCSIFVVRFVLLVSFSAPGVPFVHIIPAQFYYSLIWRMRFAGATLVPWVPD